MSLILVVQSSQAWSGNFDKGILWQVKKDGNQYSYILGTVHSDDPSVTNLPKPVQVAFDTSTSFTAELDMNLASLLQAQVQMFLPENRSLKTIIGKRQFTKCVALMGEYGIPVEIVEKMKPWAIAAQLNLPKPSSGLFLDLKLYQMAQQTGKRIYGLETVAEQIGVFDNLTERQQILMLEQAISDHSTMPERISQLIRYYVRRDLRGLQAFSKQEIKRADPVIADVLESKLLHERNHRMVKRMQPQLTEGRAFIAIGVLHLPGKQGVLQLLEQRGYRVIPVY